MARRGLVLILVPALAAGGAAPSGFAAAQPEVRGGVVRDGAPTARACAAYGYNLERSRLADMMASASPGALPMPSPQYRAPAPSPPVGLAPPPPAASPSVSDVTVTARRAEAAELGRYGPFVPPRPFPRPDTERYPQAAPNAVQRVAEAPVSTFSIDVDTASYSNVRRFLNEGRSPPRDAVRVEELINYFDYDYPQPESRAEPFRSFVALAPSPWAAGKQILHVGLQGYTLPKASRAPVNLTFLVDVSGSMNPADRLPLAKKSLNLLIDQLRPEDKVSMAVYAGAAGVVLEPTAGTDKLRMRCAVEALEAGGSTAGGAGMALAYKLARQNFRQGQVNRVILMTDGDFNVGVTDDKRLEDFVAEQRKTGVYLSVFGYGRGNYQDARMQAISQAGNGTAAYVDSLTEARRLFAQEFTRQVFPIADDVKIQIEFNPARVADYRLIGYETRLLNREDFNNDAVDAGEVGTGASVTALYELTPARGAGSVDPLRYQREDRREGGRAGPAASREIAFLKLRYKRPGAQTSTLAERPITDRDAFGRLDAAPEQTRWAVAVAAYGQRLRGDAALRGGMDWREIGQLAAGAKGEDALGVRAEFLDLVRKASGRRTELGRN
jgi:Ca-activated chloride channel family protein